MPFCIECGNSYPDEGKFCPHCGKPNKLLNKTKTPVLDSTDDLRQKTDVSGEGSYGVSIKDLPNGTTLENGRYNILEKLGEGGFGVVYKASDANYNGRSKALKIIYSENYSDRLVMHKLKAEALNMIEINHPNVVRLYDTHFEHEIKFMDMEFVDGGDLVDLMLESPNHQIPELKVWQLATQIAQGMRAIHQMHIIHQDLKPENILLTKQGVVKITDFGISETFRSSKSRIEESDVKGTFLYASPEQLIGKNVGKESDVWSFGTTLYHILTGKTLYSGNQSSDVLLQINNREFEPIPDLSTKMNALLTKCLKREYQERFRDFGELFSFIKQKPESQPGNVLIKDNNAPKTENTADNGNNSTSKLQEKDILNKKLKSKKRKAGYFIILALIMLVVLIVSNVYFKKKAAIPGTLVFVKGGTFPMGSVDGEQDDEKLIREVALSDFYIGKYEVTQAEYQSIMGKNPSEDFSYRIKLKDNDKVAKVSAFGMTAFNKKFGKDNYYIIDSPEMRADTRSLKGDNNPFGENSYDVIESPEMRADTRSLKGDNNPVQYVSWHDAVEFCNKKSRIEGLEPVYSGSEENFKYDFTKNGYRLPTEAEWEYAARGGNKSKGYAYSGSNDINEVAEYKGNNGKSNKPVGGRKPNELGIYDMSGNVWEWCNDWYDSYSSEAHTDPVGPTSGSRRVYRGGGWNLSATSCRVASRDNYYPSSSSYNLGFRVARSSK